MKTLIWRGNISGNVFSVPDYVPVSTSDSLVVCEIGEKSESVESKTFVAPKILYLDDGCVHEARCSSVDEDADDSPSIFHPLSSFRVVSVHCNYGIFGVVTNNNQVFMWGASDRGQCGCVIDYVKRPKQVIVKTDDAICSHGFRETGGRVPVERLSFGRSLTVAAASDGSCWCWGALYPDDEASTVAEPYPVTLNRRVINVVCGEYHYLALVEASPDRGVPDQNLRPASPPDSYRSTRFLEGCSECRAAIRRASDHSESNFFDDSANVCPLGLKLEFSEQIFNDCSFAAAPKSNESTPSKSRKFSSTAPAAFFDGSAVEMVELRKTKSAGNRFSFISFDYNAADSSSSSDTLSDNNFFEEQEEKLGKRKTKKLQESNICVEVWSWGSNDRGQLGLGDCIKRSQPCRMDKLCGLNVTKLDAGMSHSVALTAAGEVFVWGSNVFGQIKQTSEMQTTPAPFKIGSRSSALDVAAGGNFTVLLVNNLEWKPEVYYCGANYCDDGTMVVDRLSNWTKIFNGWPISCGCFNDLVMLPAKSDRNRHVFAKFYELIFTEMKFAQKLKQIYTFGVQLFKKNVYPDPVESDLAQEFLQALRKFYLAAAENVRIMKESLSVAGKWSSALFFSGPSSVEYSASLKSCHSIYCRIIAAGGFSLLKITEDLEPDLRQLASLNDVESSKESRLLKKLFYSPFKRLAEYSELVQGILIDATIHVLGAEERDWLTDFLKKMKILEQLSANLFTQAEKTHHFWSKNANRAPITSLKKLGRLLVKEFCRNDGVSSVTESGSSLSFQELMLFSDCFVVTLKNSTKSFDFPLLWLVPVQDDAKFIVQIICPETLLSVEFVDGISKNAFVQTASQCLSKFLNGPYSETYPGTGPPLRRKGRYAFSSKHAGFANSTYIGAWLLGKPHGSGHLVFHDGRQFHGKFKDGLMHGYGEMRNRPDFGPTIRGYWKESALTGLAVVGYGNGSVYEGYLKNGAHSGHGVLRKRSQTYFGAWEQDKRCGYGVCDRGKEKYLGMWRNDKEHGCGCVVTLDGVYYEGTFEDGVFVKGLMLAADGTKYEGEFNGVGRLSGKGSIFFPNGDKIAGQLTGYVHDGVKIVSGEYSRGSGSPPDSPESCRSSVCVNVVSADQKWTDVFSHVYDNLGAVDGAETSQIWDNLVSNLQKLKKLFDSKNSDNSLEGLDVIPDWSRPFDESYYNTVKSYCTAAFRRVYHPLGRLLVGLTDVFNATYSGVGAHPSLLPHAVAEVGSLVLRFYQLIRLLFPNLPPESEMNRLLTEPSSDIYSKPADFETSCSFLYDCFLQEVYPTLFTLYVVQNDGADGRFWARIKTLNSRNDVALLDAFNVDKHLWPIRLSESVRDSNVLDTPLICATARSKYYADAIECLQRLSSEFYPSAKLKVVVDTFFHINECVSRFSSEQSVHTWSADSLVPVTMYVVVRAQIQRLGAEIRLIEDFSPQLRYLGQVQYLLATLQGCYNHVMQDKNLF